MSGYTFPRGIPLYPGRKTRVYLAGPMRGYDDFNFPAFNAAAHELETRGGGFLFDVFNPADLGDDKTFEEYMKIDLAAVIDADMVVVLDGWEKSEGATAEVFVAQKCGIPVFAYPNLIPVVVTGKLEADLEPLPFEDERASLEDPATELVDAHYESVVVPMAEEFIIGGARVEVNDGGICAYDVDGNEASRVDWQPDHAPINWAEINDLNAPLEETVLQEADRLVAVDRQQDYGHPLDDFTRVGGAAKALGIDPTRSPEEHGLYMVLVKVARESNRHKRDNLVDIAGYAKTIDLVHAERAQREADELSYQ